MTDSHLPVWEWEPGEPPDEKHLRECQECARNWEVLQFLHFQAENAPEPEASPFFASRVANIAAAEAVPVWTLLERAARRLIPVFASLALIAVLGLVYWAPSEPSAGDYAELLSEPDAQTDLTLDDVLYSLSFPLEEDSTVENQ